MKYFHFSLHDVAPHHLSRLRSAEDLFVKWGISKVTYLLVPDFHHRGSASESVEFAEFVRKKRPFQVEWALHGEFHVENAIAACRVPNRETAWKRKHMTGGEGEFLALTKDEIVDSLDRGHSVFSQVCGFSPQIFVPPAWLYNEELHPILRSMGFCLTEDHYGIYDIQRNEFIPASVVTWATRTWLRRWGSLIVCPILYRRGNKQNLIRIAVHPHDFDFEITQKSIASVLSKALLDRQSLSLNEILLHKGAF